MSDGDFSFIMTYGAFARSFGFGLLAVKLWTARSATGVSFKTLQLYALVSFWRRGGGREGGRAGALLCLFGRFAFHSFPSFPSLPPWPRSSSSA